MKRWIAVLAVALALPVSAPAFAGDADRAQRGLVVVAITGATDLAWPLAKSAYATPSMRPTRIDDAQARVLCGERPAPGATPDIRDLAADVAAIRGEDAPSRALLADVARRMLVRAVIVVRLEDERPTARVFLAETGAFDAATYSPDSGPSVSWTAAIRSLARVFGTDPAEAPVPTPAPVLATHETLPTDGASTTHRPFYASYWFWGGVAAAAALGGVLYLTRSNGATALHMQMNIPH